jgi:hypothetical protein
MILVKRLGQNLFCAWKTSITAQLSIPRLRRERRLSQAPQASSGWIICGRKEHITQYLSVLRDLHFPPLRSTGASNRHRGVGPPRAADFGLPASVDPTDARRRPSAEPAQAINPSGEIVLSAAVTCWPGEALSQRARLRQRRAVVPGHPKLRAGRERRPRPASSGGRNRVRAPQRCDGRPSASRAGRPALKPAAESGYQACAAPAQPETGSAPAANPSATAHTRRPPLVVLPKRGPPTLAIGQNDSCTLAGRTRVNWWFVPALGRCDHDAQTAPARAGQS